MRILLIEDSAGFAGRLQKAFSEAVWTVAETTEDALAALQRPHPDVVICDLRIPQSKSELEPDPAHGLTALDAVRLEWPGVPVVILSGYGKLETLGDRLTDAQHAPYRRSEREPLVRHFIKDDADKVLADLALHVDCLRELDRIEIADGGREVSLDEYDRRLLRLYAQQRSASGISVRDLKGGQSGARTLALALQEGPGEASHAVAKLGVITEANDEYQRFIDHVNDRVEIGRFTPVSGFIASGAGPKGGLFYRLADGFDRSLFALLRADPEAAAAVVAQLQAATKKWHQAATQRHSDVRWVRQCLVRDARLPEIGDRGPWFDAELEDRYLEVNRARQHGDMHGENVLVNGAGDPMLIDFGRAGWGPAALDPVTLEMSAYLHPDAGLDLGNWLTPSHAENWGDRKAFVADCPIAPFVEACRDWATSVARGDREVLATAASYSYRQLRYPDADQQLAGALSLGASKKLRRSYDE